MHWRTLIGMSERPKEMDAKAGSGTAMHVWKRQK